MRAREVEKGKVLREYSHEDFLKMNGFAQSGTSGRINTVIIITCGLAKVQGLHK